MTSVVTHATATPVARFHRWRAAQDHVTLTLLALGWACLMGLLAQVRVPLPFTPVPFTLQVFGVLLGAVLLGARHGTLAQGLYVGAGIVGVPWFQGFQGGLGYLAGATGGYLAAFPVAALVVGVLVHRLGARSYAGLLAAMVAGMAVVYAGGVLGLMLLLGLAPWQALLAGVAPFVLLDAGKALLAAGLAKPLLPPGRS